MPELWYIEGTHKNVMLMHVNIGILQWMVPENVTLNWSGISIRDHNWLWILEPWADQCPKADIRKQNKKQKNHRYISKWGL